MATERFKRFEKTLGVNEGGYANNPDDKGGETYRGIARNYHSQWKGWDIIDNYKKQIARTLKNNEFIKNATLDTLVSDFYFTNFYSAVKADSIKNESIAMSIYDYAVNRHPISATTLAQSILKNNFLQKITVDGKMGNQTIDAINKANQAIFFEAYNQGRIAHYKEQSKKPNQAQFLTSWLSRVQRLSFSPTVATAIGFGTLFFLA